jgi:hypothetical protein
MDEGATSQTFEPADGEQPVQAFVSDVPAHVPAFRRKHFKRIQYNPDGEPESHCRKDEIEALERKRAAALVAREQEENAARIRAQELAAKRAAKLREDELAEAAQAKLKQEIEAKRHHLPKIETPREVEGETSAEKPPASAIEVEDAQMVALRQQLALNHSRLLDEMEHNPFDKALHQRLRNEMKRSSDAMIQRFDERIRVKRQQWPSTKRYAAFQAELQTLIRQRDRYARYLQSDEAAQRRLYLLHNNSYNNFPFDACSRTPYEDKTQHGGTYEPSEDGESIFSFDANPINYRIGAHAMEMSSDGSLSDRAMSARRLGQQRQHMMAAIKTDARRASATARQRPTQPFNSNTRISHASPRSYLSNPVKNRPPVQIRNPMIVGRVKALELGCGVLADMKFSCGDSMTLDITIDNANTSHSPDRQPDLAKTIIKIADAANRQIDGLHIDTNKL